MSANRSPVGYCAELELRARWVGNDCATTAPFAVTIWPRGRSNSRVWPVLSNDASSPYLLPTCQ